MSAGGIGLVLIGAVAAGDDGAWRRFDLFDLSSNAVPDATSADVFVRAGGRFAVDLTRYDPDNQKSNGFSNEIVRPLVEGEAYGTSFRFEFDAVGVDSRDHMFDAWLGRELTDHVSLQIGRFRVAMASEYATREENSPFLGESFTSYLTGRYDVGVRGEAAFFGDALGFEAAAVAGEGFGLEGEGKHDPLLLVRGTLQPFRDSEAAWFQGFWFGAATSFLPRFTDELRVTTPLQSVVLVTPRLDADRAAFAAIEAGWSCGAFRVGCEAARGFLDNVDKPGGGSFDLDHLSSWTAYASCFLVGGAPEWRRGRWLKPTWDPATTPLELAVRYSKADFDRDLFRSGLAAVGPSTTEARSFGADLSWYPESGTRVAFGWVETIAAEDLDTFGGSDRDSSFVLRFEVVL